MQISLNFDFVYPSSSYFYVFSILLLLIISLLLSTIRNLHLPYKTKVQRCKRNACVIPSKNCNGNDKWKLEIKVKIDTLINWKLLHQNSLMA